MTLLRWSVVLAGFLALPARASDPPPHRRAAMLLVKVLSYDYTLAARCRDALRIGVAYRQDLPRSVASAHAMLAAFGNLADERFTVQRLRITASLVPFLHANEAAERAGRGGVNAIYVADGVPPDALSPLLARARRERWSTLATDASLVRRGVAVGVVVHERAFRILINARAASAQGSRFSAELFKVARIVPEAP